MGQNQFRKIFDTPGCQTMAQQQATDVAVIGGGPAGSAAATMLARQGWRVVLLERERFPREHVGESLLPASMPVLEELGAMEAVQAAGFLPKYGATMVWGRDPEPWSWHFRETSVQYPHAYQVWRPTFDHIMLDNARRHGLDVREGCRVAAVDWPTPGTDAIVKYVSDTGGQHELSTRFVVDATGQAALLAQQAGTRRWDPFFQNLAVYAYFEGAKPLRSPDENNIFIEAFEHGWFWTIPLGSAAPVKPGGAGWSSVGAVVDNRTGQEGIQRLGAREFLMGQLSQAPHTLTMLRDARWVAGPSVVRDWSYSAERTTGPGFVMTGDSACFVDPLFSSGVHLALMSGVIAAAYATTALKASENGDEQLRDQAGEVYQELYYKEYNQFREMARLFYASNLTSDSYFWEARRITGESEYTPRQSFIQAVAGQPPRGYERVVLDRGEAPADFVTSVQAVEGERSERVRRISGLRSDPQRNQILNAVPRLADGVRVARRPVLGEGEFVWGYSLSAVSQPEGMPCSELVAALVSITDGRSTVSTLVDRLGQGLDQRTRAQMEAAISHTVEILYIDGTIDQLGAQ